MLVARLRAQRPALDEAIHAHVRAAVAGLGGDEHPGYEVGQYAAVAAAVDYGLSGLEHGDGNSEPVPPATLAQARRAARQGVPLDAVLRSYHAGQAKLSDIIMEEVERGELASQPAFLRLILGLQASLLDRLTADIASEFILESRKAERSCERERAERVQLLLEGSSTDVSRLGYEFHDAWHIGVIALGPRAEQALGALATALGRELLSVPRGREEVWGWLGGSRRVEISDVMAVPLGERAGVALVLGEPGEGIEGWRLTHRQTQAALRVALQERRMFTRYADVAVLAPWMAEHALAQSFIDLYLSPLDEMRGGGAVARATLRAYFRAAHQVAAAAHALNVDRGTLRKRLASIEHRLGYALHTRQAELEVALRLESLYAAPPQEMPAGVIPINALSGASIETRRETEPIHHIGAHGD